MVIGVTAAIYFAEIFVEQSNGSYPQAERVEEADYSNEFDHRFYPSSTTAAKVVHAFYQLSYSEKHEQAEWVAYELKKSHLSKNDFKRPYFVEDKKVESYSADWRNYKNSGYDRGHLCPAGDRRFNYDAYHETFLTSNISPQNHDFNAGVWNRLEQKVRYWANQYDGVFVITGGVLKDGLQTIGDERVAVPQEFYKIVVDGSGSDLKTIAFLIPNKKTSKSFYDFVVTVDEIESKTGIDFFASMEPSIEKQIEQQIDLKAWGKR